MIGGLTSQQVMAILGRSDEQLETSYLGLEALCDHAVQVMKHVSQATSAEAEEKARHARKMEILDESYCVLSAWTEFTHAALILSTHGPQSVFFEGTPMAPLADVPDVVKKRYGLL